MAARHQPPAPDQESQPPVVPGHALLRQIARGSYGEIWLARTELGALRAVKIVRRANFSDPRPFDREFAGIQRYEPISREHEGLVDILQVGRDDPAGFFYYVMELADSAGGEKEKGGKGEKEKFPSAPFPLFTSAGYTPLTLSHAIRTRSRLPASEVVELGVALARALEFLHSRRLLHRDVKPQNIIFVGGKAKLADVGLVAEVDGPQTLVGTDGYIPPEGPGSVQADIYSLGKVLYEAATGKDRQEFPDLGMDAAAAPDPALLELNEVLLKACEGNPRARYRSAAAMAADLERIEDGQSLRGRRARSRRVRGIAYVAALLIGVTGIGLGVVAFGRWQQSTPRLIFGDNFREQKLDAQKWAWSTREWPGQTNSGQREFHVGVTDGHLEIEAKAQHQDGWTTSGAAWVDSMPDLRRLGKCSALIELASMNQCGRSQLSISDGKIPNDEFDSGAVQLLSSHKDAVLGTWRELVPLAHERIRVDFLPSQGAALVYPDALIGEQFEIADLSRLQQWKLRFYALAFSSSVCTGSLAQLQVKSVWITNAPASEAIVGRVSDAVTGSPIMGAILRDETGARIGITTPKGDFKLFAKGLPIHIKAEHSDFASSELREIKTDHTKPGLVKFQLHKRVFGYGDVVDVIPCGDLEVLSIGFWKTKLCVLALNRELDHCLLLPVDLIKRKLLAPAMNFPTGKQPIGAFTQCGNRLVAVGAWPGRIYDLTAGAMTLLLEPEAAGRGGRIHWPWGAAFDSELLWFIERDTTANRFGLHSVDPLGREVLARHSLPSKDVGIIGLAWDEVGQRFWVCSQNGKVYPISRSEALRSTALEPARGREFAGDYSCLAFGAGHLWGLVGEKKEIWKIKTSD